MLVPSGFFAHAYVAPTSFLFVGSVYLLRKEFLEERQAKLTALIAVAMPLTMFNMMLVLSDILLLQ